MNYSMMELVWLLLIYSFLGMGGRNDCRHSEKEKSL